MEREIHQSIGKKTQEIPFYEVPLFAEEIERRKRRLQEVIDSIRSQQIEMQRDFVYLNISSDPKRPVELRATGKTVETLQRLVGQQDMYLAHINWDEPGEEEFEIRDDQTTPPKWLRFFPKDL